jgi:hypothetical protein
VVRSEVAILALELLVKAVRVNKTVGMKQRVRRYIEKNKTWT